MSYTYQDFEKALGESGLSGQFSRYDLDLAKRYPEFGMSVLNLKRDYGNAQTAEQRALINARANQLRSSYGNYTGGRDGGSYVSDGKYAQSIDDALGKIGSFGSFQYEAAPSYENRFQQKQQELLEAALNREPFSWSKETDPQYGSYKKTYLREGERATADALAKASAASGGRPSSYAVNAAAQAGDYYATKLNDVIPTLYQQAYERYLQDYQMKLSDLSAVNQQEQLEYAKYLDRLGQFNTDRSFAYNSYLGDYSRLQDYLAGLQGQEQTEHSRYLEELDAIREKQELQRGQIDAILQAGGSPSSELVGASGYENEYVRALENYYRQQAAQGSAKSGGSGGSRSGGSSMSLATAKAMAKEGQFNDAVLDTLHKAGFTDEYIRKVYGYDANQSGYGTVRNQGMKASEWEMVLNNIRANLRQGRVSAAEAYMDQVAGGMSREQYNQAMQLLESFGY